MYLSETKVENPKYLPKKITNHLITLRLANFTKIFISLTGFEKTQRNKWALRSPLDITNSKNSFEKVKDLAMTNKIILKIISSTKW